MIRKIVLNIRHSDDYTDYLLMTSALTDKRIVPLLDPNDNVLQLVTDSKTLVLRCEASNGEPRERRKPGPGLFINQGKGEVVVFPKYYYHADGSIDSTHAELVRSQLNDALHTILYCTNNINKLYIRCFPFLWKYRQKIYDNPQFFSTFCGRHIQEFAVGHCMSLGAVLKALEKNEGLFRMRLEGGCNCTDKPYLIDYKKSYSGETKGAWLLQTWCPDCQSFHAVWVEKFDEALLCDQAIYDVRKEYDPDLRLSNLSLFDVIDAIQDARLNQV